GKEAKAGKTALDGDLDVEGAAGLLLAGGRSTLFVGAKASASVRLLSHALDAVFEWRPHYANLASLVCLRSANFLVTTGDDDNAIPTLSIWNLDKIDKKQNNAPLKVRSIPLHVNNRVFPVTALAVLESLAQIAVGLENGNVLLIRGNARSLDRQALKIKVVCEAGQVITGLGFKETVIGNTVQTLLYITTPGKVILCNSTNSKEVLTNKYNKNHPKTVIDETNGASPNCTIPTPPDDPCSAIAVGRNDGIYFYDSKGRGSCFMIESEKTLMSWFRNYLVVVSRSPSNTQSSSSAVKNDNSKMFNAAAASSSLLVTQTGNFGGSSSGDGDDDEDDEFENDAGYGTILTLYDLRCKLIAFQGTFDGSGNKNNEKSRSGRGDSHGGGIVSVACEWDELFITTVDQKVYRLDEKDMSARLEILFSKNMYILAQGIVTAPTNSVLSVTTPPPTISQQQQEIVFSDTPEVRALLVEIHKRHADHLYTQTEYASAMTQYKQTIGTLEPSYIIRKYLDAQRIPLLVSYLETLHSTPYATADHTTLLINCYTKLSATDSLSAFLRRPDVSFDAETAIRVCRGAGLYSHALYVAQRFGVHEWYLHIQVEDLHAHGETVAYMTGLAPAVLEACLRRYGHVLVREMVEEMSGLLVVLCTTARRRGDDEMSGSATAGAALIGSGGGAFDEEDSAAASVVAAGGMVVMRGRRRSTTTITSSTNEGIVIPYPEDFVHLFVDMDEWCVKFLERVLEIRWSVNLEGKFSKGLVDEYKDDGADRGGVGNQAVLMDEREEKSLLAVCNTLIEMYLSLAAGSVDGGDKVAQERRLKALRIMKSSKTRFDLNHALILCQIHKFHAGVISEDPRLWQTTLSYFADRSTGTNSAPSSESELALILDEIDKRNLMSPLQVIQILSQNQGVTIGTVREYLLKKFEAEKRVANDSTRVIKSFQDETSKMKALITELETAPVVFQSSKCSLCGEVLDLPSIHFMCKHSYHARCARNGDDDEEEGMTTTAVSEIT
ncbi:Vacuolar protein sorting-associated protein 11, partial [Physocladia obscura]